MALLSLRNVSVSYGGPMLLDGVDFQVERGERVCLLGRNGEGKSTFLRVVEGVIEPDHGEVIRQQGLKVARLPQDVPTGLVGTIGEVVTAGVHTEQFNIEHVGQPGQRMPVGGMKGAKGPGQAFSGDAPADLRIFDHVLQVVVSVQKIKSDALPVYEHGENHQTKADNHLGAVRQPFDFWKKDGFH